MKNPVEFYESFIQAPSAQEQAKAVLYLIDDLPTRKDFLILENAIKFLDQKIDSLRSEMHKSITGLSNVMYGGFAVMFAALAYLIFKI